MPRTWRIVYSPFLCFVALSRSVEAPERPRGRTCACRQSLVTSHVEAEDTWSRAKIDWPSRTTPMRQEVHSKACFFVYPFFSFCKVSCEKLVRGSYILLLYIYILTELAKRNHFLYIQQYYQKCGLLSPLGGSIFFFFCGLLCCTAVGRSAYICNLSTILLFYIYPLYSSICR